MFEWRFGAWKTPTWLCGRVALPEARAAACGAECAFVVLLPPTRMEEVRRVADAGQVMPQKSTFFAPKIPTGVVIRRFDGED